MSEGLCPGLFVQSSLCARDLCPEGVFVQKGISVQQEGLCLRGVSVRETPIQ